MGQLRWLVKISYKSREFSVYTAATLSLPQPDHGVLRKAQRGDERAFSIIVRAYQIPVYNYVLRMVGDRSLAEDLTQEVFLRVYQGLPRFSLRSKFTTWMFQVTKNRVLDELRATERRPRAVVDLDDIPPLEVVDAPFERLQAIDAVWRAADRLHVALQMAVLVRDVVGLAYSEIADAVEGGALRGEIQQEVGGPRVAVPRLPYRTGVEERSYPVQFELLAVRRDAACELVAGLHHLQCDVAVPDEDEWRVGKLERRQG